MSKNIFITGSTGCIGVYIAEQLINNNDYKLFLLVRDKSRVIEKINSANNVVLLQGDLNLIQDYEEEIKQAHYIINTATTWGGANDTNVGGVEKMLSFVDPKRLKKFIQFETASILGRGNVVLEEAKTSGTGYIQCKYDIYHLTKNHKLTDKIIRVYPTVVIGGAKDRPYSHISKGLLKLKEQLKWLKYLYIDFGFHYMHSQDIAKCVIHIMENIDDEHDLVLGNDYITLKDFLKQAARYYSRKSIIMVKIPNWFISFVINVFRVKISAWDRFCFQYKFFKYNTVNCRTFGLATDKFTVAEILQDVEGNR